MGARRRGINSIRDRLFIFQRGLDSFYQRDRIFFFRKAIAVDIQEVGVGNDEPFRIMKIHRKPVVPIRVAPGSAGLCLHAFIQTEMRPCGEVLVPIGIAAKPPSGTYIRIVPRSGFSLNMISIGVGVDGGYIGEICVVVCIRGVDRFEVLPNMKFVQMIIEVIATFEIVLVDNPLQTASGTEDLAVRGYAQRFRQLLAIRVFRSRGGDMVFKRRCRYRSNSPDWF